MSLRIDARFNGPPPSANGGYTSGRLASYVDAPTVRVALRRPPPLDVALEVSADGDSVTLSDAEGVIAIAEPGRFAGDPPPFVDLDSAREAVTAFRGWHEHPFPGCFVCGPDRGSGDGLRLFAGPVEGRHREGVVACSFTPDASLLADGETSAVGAEFGWSALDCPGGWSSDLQARPLVLGTMTASVDTPLAVDRPHVVVDQFVGTEDRKTTTATALYDPDGTLLGRAEHVWIAIDPSTFGRLQASCPSIRGLESPIRGL